MNFKLTDSANSVILSPEKIADIQSKSSSTIIGQDLKATVSFDTVPIKNLEFGMKFWTFLLGLN